MASASRQAAPQEELRLSPEQSRLMDQIIANLPSLPTQQQKMLLGQVILNLQNIGLDSQMILDLNRHLTLGGLNIGTPLESGLDSSTIESSSENSLAWLLAIGIAGVGKAQNREKCAGIGLAAFCENYEDANTLMFGIQNSFARVLQKNPSIFMDMFPEFSTLPTGQTLSGSLHDWLSGKGTALRAQALRGMTSANQEEWLEENLEFLENAIIFQANARKNGTFTEEFDRHGRLIYGALWDYAKPISERVELGSEGWNVAFVEDRNRIARAYKEMPSLTETILASAPPAETEGSALAGVTPMRTWGFSDFLSFYSTNESRSFTDNTSGWIGKFVSTYNSRHRREGVVLDVGEVRRAAAFYMWATEDVNGATRLSEEERDGIGRDKFRGLWDFAVLVGSNLEYSTNKRSWVFKTMRDIETAQAAFSRLPVPGEMPEPQATAVAAAPVEEATRTAERTLAETDAVISLARRYNTGGDEPRSVPPEYIVEAVNLILQGRTGIEFGFVGTASPEEGGLSVGSHWIGNRFAYNFGPLGPNENDLPNSSGLAREIISIATALRNMGVRTTTARLTPEQQDDLAGRMA